MSNIDAVMDTTYRGIPEHLAVKRSDPVYMAHAYLTKVPVPAIVPFIEAFTAPGDIVLDPFAGSGMTGIAAAALGRGARLFDVSVLGRHVGRGYLNLVPAGHLRKRAHEVLTAAQNRLGDIYGTTCSQCGRRAELVKTVWSVLIACPGCNQPVNYYRAFEDAKWKKDRLCCPRCQSALSSRDQRLGEEPVLNAIACSCQSKQIEQDWTRPRSVPDLTALQWPDRAIEPTRQMYVASALGRHGLTTTASFFSNRNLAALAAVHEAIRAVPEPALREKLLFTFTAILTRASKRYQWSRKRPLNAANANYYVAPVFYEWNVFDLFSRKLEAVIKSDDWIRDRHGADTLFDSSDTIDIDYQIASAATLPLPDASVDYVFTDPPFGSNIFYSDMSLFHEVWLGEFTDDRAEAVVDRVDTGQRRTAASYEQVLLKAMQECRRVLKPCGHITMVFGNSSGAVWSLVQRAIAGAGLAVVPQYLSVLDKGQRSVKGLASGFENVTTLDLILTMRPSDDKAEAFITPPAHELDDVVTSCLASNRSATPSHIYLELIRTGLRKGWDLGHLDLRHVTAFLQANAVAVDAKTSRLEHRTNRRRPSV